AVGCGGVEEPSPAAALPAKKKEAPATAVEKKPEPPPPEPVKPFTSIPEAVSALTKAVDANDQKEIMRADQWLVGQGAAAIPPLAEILRDDGASVAHRITACRTLGQIPGGKAALLEAVDAKERMVRVNVVQVLGRIQPADKDLVNVCMRLAKDSDPQVQQYAIRSLGKMKLAAKDAVPLMTEILNNREYN